jgi:subtilisin family serine protease
MVTGYQAPGVHGTTAGIAPGAPYAHFKALNTFPGAGKTSWILNGMFNSLRWGADIISMSLGGTQQGPLEEDPYCRFIRKNCKENAGDENGAIFVVAAGNSGPESFTIGSPGVAEKALTVASWSITDQAPANFTSRGPSGGYYSDKPQELQTAKSTYGAEEVVKPDLCAPGGGRENAEKASNRGEKLFQVSTGWFDGFNDGLKDNRASMKGTSMATPAVAGFMLRLYESGIIQTAAEAKEAVRQQDFQMSYPEASEGANTTENGKNIAIGYGPFRESTFE